MRRTVLMLMLLIAISLQAGGGTSDAGHAMPVAASSLPLLPYLQPPALSLQPAAARRLDATLDLAGKMLSLGRLEEARKLYREALALHPDDVDVAAALLEVERRRGDDDSQLPLFDRVLAHRPRDRELLLARAACLWRLGRTVEALKAWRAMPREFPGDARLLKDLTEVFLGIGRFDDASEMLRVRRRRFGEDAYLLLDDARLRLAQDAPADALPLLMRAADMDIENDALRRAVENLLLAVARRTKKTDDVVAHLRDRVAACDVRLAERLATLAEESARRNDFPEAVRLAHEALRHLTDEKARQAMSEKIEDWNRR